MNAIAVIGMSGRFPMAPDLAQYWRNLRDGIECISYFPPPDVADGASDGTHVYAGGLLENLDLFDASFFGISARDAEVTDPQQRIFLECAWHALEDASYNPETYPGAIGVFAGAAMSSYVFDLYASPTTLAHSDDFQIQIGNDKDHLTTQASYKLNLRGPSMAVQTACSTSLVTVCIACQSLLSRECDMALAGGVCVEPTAADGYVYQPGGILSSDGHCRPFDADAEGTVPGNGVGIVVLKRLADAIADRDNIRAVIRGFALNNDGSTKVGYTAPSINGQSEVIARALAMAGVDPSTISYIETHGTATPLGDPIEIAALERVFGARGARKQFCALGSVKSNIGHLDTAAGIAGFIKTVLALEHRELPPSLHFTRPNPKIDFDNSPFYVNAALAPWPSNGHPRRAGVSSYGIGGTNAHVVVEEAPPRTPAQQSSEYCVLTLSGRTSSALEAATDELAERLDAQVVNLVDVAYTQHVGRKAFDHRRALVCLASDSAAATAALQSRDPLRVLSTVRRSGDRPPAVVFMFPGQGTQRVNMALDIYAADPRFRAQVDTCSELFQPHVGRDLREVLFPTREASSEANDVLGRTQFTQPALFTIEYALAQLLIEWGIRPAAMIGHSIGEYVAACVSGVFSLEDAIRLVALRGRLMSEMETGGMLAVPIGEHDIQQYLFDGLSLAAINGPSSCVVSGPAPELSELERRLARTGLSGHRLATSHAFHSSMMDAAVAPFVASVQRVQRSAPQVPFISNVTGTWITGEDATDPVYWGKQLRRTVRFGDGLQQIYAAATSTLVEVGPGHTLSNLARQHPARPAGHAALASLAASQDRDSDLPALMNMVARLWLSGVEIDWQQFHATDPGRRTPLPVYPFQRQRYWIRGSHEPVGDEDLEEDLDTRNVANWLYAPVWRPAPPSDPSRVGAADTEVQRRWLVFCENDGLAAQFVARLRSRGEDVTCVLAGEGFARTGGQVYVIRPDQRTDYVALIQELRAASGGIPPHIVHAWSLTPYPTAQSGPRTFDDWQERGFYSLIFLAQALASHAPGGAFEISVVSNEIQAVLGTEPLEPAKATVLGACKVIPQEHTNIRCRSVDVDIDGSDRQAADRVLDLLDGDLVAESFEPVVAYRRGRRWTERFDSVFWDGVISPATRLRTGGVYMITGGLGKIGLLLAETLARTVTAKLVLMSRSGFPARSEWRERLASRGRDSGTRDRIRKLLEIEELGAELMIVSADAADEASMRRVISDAEARFGAIHGVIHAAGDTSRIAPVAEIDHAAGQQQFAGKALGLIALDELVRDKELDFCLVLSSLSSVLGGLGLAAYAASNIFQDAFARKRNQDGAIPWISVNFDAWYFEGREGESERPASATNFILPDEGAELFLRIVDRAPRQIIVSTTDLAERFRQWVLLEDAQGVEPREAPLQDPQHPRPDLPSAYVAPRSELEERLVQTWQQLLGVEPVGISDSFFELGGHSLLAIQLISRLREAWQVEVPVHRIFEAPTIAELAELIDASRQRDADEEAKTAELLAYVEQLSDTEVRALLEEQAHPV